MAALDEGQARQALVAAGKRLQARGLITATEGNLSLRLDAGRLLVTPAGVDKSALRPEDIVLTDADGRPLGPCPPLLPTSELPMHVAIYRRRLEILAVVHSHPPAASAFAIAHERLDVPVLAETVMVLGPVPLVPYATPSTARLAQLVAAAAAASDALLLANHGAVTVGVTLRQALERMETLEHLARVRLLARSLGGERPLGTAAVQELLNLRAAGRSYAGGDPDPLALGVPAGGAATR